MTIDFRMKYFTLVLQLTETKKHNRLTRNGLIPSSKIRI